MRLYISPTNYEWYLQLMGMRPDEVNFWLPSGSRSFKALQPGEPLLFKSKTKDTGITGPGFVMGGGFFVRYVTSTVSLAWQAFGEKNGVPNSNDFLARIQSLGGDTSAMDPAIGCIILNEPFFFPRELWVPAPAGFPITAPQGKGYDATDPEARRVWDAVVARIADPRAIVGPESNTSVHEPGEAPAGGRYGTPYLTSSRLGQGAFHLSVLDAYRNRCAVTGEKVRPVLEAAHIKPYSLEGPNVVPNGLTLRADIHKLFDRGYVTVDKDLRFRVSSLLKSEFDNGIDYYRYQGDRLAVLPERPSDMPAPSYLEWHNDVVFRP